MYPKFDCTDPPFSTRSVALPWYPTSMFPEAVKLEPCPEMRAEPVEPR